MRRAVPVIVVIAFSLLLPNTVLAVPRDAFVGTWEVVVTPDEGTAGEKEFKDTFTFKGMQFTSAAFKQRGFDSTTYEEDTRSGIAATFKAEGKSKTNQGTAVWTGQSQAQTLNGELTWTKPDGTVLHYTFKGERKN
jgi:hypothetical protein